MTSFLYKKRNSLLPNYITQKGDFLYDLYFEEKLLKIEVEIQKIDAYLVPIILKYDINVII